MTTALLGITSAVQAALATPALATGKGSVVRGRRTMVPQAEKWHVAINALRHAGNRLDLQGLALQWETIVSVVVSVRAASDEDAEAALDPLIETVWSRLYSMTLPAGVQRVTLDPQINLDIDEADKTLAVASLSLRVTHITTGGLLAA